jgi:hypothetical protein
MFRSRLAAAFLSADAFVREAHLGFPPTPLYMCCGSPERRLGDRWLLMAFLVRGLSDFRVVLPRAAPLRTTILASFQRQRKTEKLGRFRITNFSQPTLILALTL